MKNREIKFRAWDGEKMIFCDFNSRIKMILSDLYLDGKVTQFTGLHDKNGKKCFEGDIVKRICDDGKERISTIIYHDDWGAFAFRTDHHTVSGYGLSHMHSGHSMFWWEIIGNIYENPELINN